MRLLLLEVMQRSRVETFPSSWQTTLKQNLQHNNRDVRLQAVRIVQDRKFDAFDSHLKQSVLSETEPADLRVEELIALAPRLASVDRKLFDFVTGRFAENVAPLDRLAAARALAELPLTDKQLMQLAGRLDSAGPMAVPVFAAGLFPIK